MIFYIYTYEIILDLIALLLAAVLIIVPVIKWKKWKILEKEYEKENRYRPYSDYHYSFDSWLKDNSRALISVALAVLLIMVGSINFYFDVDTVWNNRCKEPSNYETMIVQGETIREALGSTTDIVNTDLYIKAIDYNSELTTIKAKCNDPKYSINFSGNYDWNNIKLIEIS